jgi:RNA polymerase sigma-70 factor, ECF subfamily
MTDREMVMQFLESRSDLAFRTLYRSKTPSLMQIAMRISGFKKDVAEELIQEMWIIAIRKLPEFEWKAELKTWLVAILINLSRKKTKIIFESLESIENKIDANFSGTDCLDLEMGISQLPPGYREIIILHDVEGFKHNEIAEMLQISEGTSKSQLFQARKNLRGFLTRKNHS